MKQNKHLLSINAHRTEHLYTPVKTLSPMPIGFAGFGYKFSYWNMAIGIWRFLQSSIFHLPYSTDQREDA